MERTEGLVSGNMWGPERQQTNFMRQWAQLDREEVTTGDPDRYRGLVAAIIHRAIEDMAPSYYLPPRPTIAVPFPSKIAPETRDAFQWMFVDEGQGVLSFAWCCGVLELSVREMRLKVGALHPAVCWACAKEVAVGLEL